MKVVKAKSAKVQGARAYVRARRGILQLFTNYVVSLREDVQRFWKKEDKMMVKKLNSVNKQKDRKREIKEKEVKARRKGGWDKNEKKGGKEEKRKIAPSSTNDEGAMHIRKCEMSEMLNHESW